MRICIVSPNLPPMAWPCGAADFADQFARRLTEAGQQVTVLTSNPNANRDHIPYAVQVIAGTWNWGHLGRIARWIVRTGFDIVDLQYEAAMYRATWAVMFLPYLAKRRGTGWVISLHSQSLPAWGGRWWRPLQLLPYAAAIFYTRSFQQNMERQLRNRKENFHFQPFPSNIELVASPSMAALVGKIKSGQLRGQFVLLYFGQIARQRGIEDLLAALVKLRAAGARPQLVLVSQFDPGENPYHRELVCLLDRLRLGSQVSFTGRLDSEAVSRMFQTADVCVLPFPDGASFKNGSLAAAIAHAVPVVTTATELSDAELLSSGGMLTHAPGDVQALATQLYELIQSPAACERARVRMQELRQLLAWQTYIRNRLCIYQSLASQRGAGSTVRYSHAQSA